MPARTPECFIPCSTVCGSELPHYVIISFSPFVSINFWCPLYETHLPFQALSFDLSHRILCVALWRQGHTGHRHRWAEEPQETWLRSWGAAQERIRIPAALHECIVCVCAWCVVFANELIHAYQGHRRASQLLNYEWFSFLHSSCPQYCLTRIQIYPQIKIRFSPGLANRGDGDCFKFVFHREAKVAM